MIATINKKNLSLAMDFCNTKHVLACEIYSSLKVYGKDCSWAFVGMEKGETSPFCAIKTVQAGYMLYAESLTEEQVMDVVEFLQFMPKRDLIATPTILMQFKKHLGGIIESKSIMEKILPRFNNDMFNILPYQVQHPIKFVDMFALLMEAFPTACPHTLADDWVYLVSLKERRGLAQTRCIYQEGECVSCAMIDGQNQASVLLASVVTTPEYQGRGLAQYIVQTLLNQPSLEEKSVFVVLYEENLENFYKKMGFAQHNERYGTLVLSI